ncbi:hypothetical protein AB2T14_001839 [Clostridium botulinum]|nr:colicin immunity domain-containing protein [Clostridium sporogenes]
MISEKLINLTKYYVLHERTKEEMIEFCNQYDVIFSNFAEEIFTEVDDVVYEILDEIFRIVDSYEPNEDIRNSEPYCIDEVSLKNNVKNELKLLEKRKN